MTFPKTIIFIALTLLITACNLTHTQGPLSGEINMEKLHNPDEKYGVIVFRGMFFEKKGVGYLFAVDSKFPKLTIDNILNVNIKPVSTDKRSDFYSMYKAQYTNFSAKENLPFVITPEKSEFFNSRPAILRSSFFYNVLMVPEGWYYISEINKHIVGGVYKAEYDKDELPFYVKSWQINYIGDFYVMSPEHTGSWFSNKYMLRNLLVNKDSEAIDYIKQFYPQLNLPFKNRLIVKNKEAKDQNK